MSPWIESHHTLRYHPKTVRLARLLGVTVPTAIGHLHCLWWWATDYAPDGDLTAIEPDVVADGAAWDGDPQIFLDGLINATKEKGGHGFLEADGDHLVIHDWYDYAGKLIERREQDRLRKAEARRTPVQRTSRGHPADGARTEPTLTTPNPLTPLVGKARFSADFEEWWSAYGRVGDKARAFDLYSWWKEQGSVAEELLIAAHHYRTHCERTDTKMKHATTFLAKPAKGKSPIWPEWAEGEPHGSMNARSDARLSDVITAGAQAFGLTGGHHEPDQIGKRPTRTVGGGADAGRGLPAGRVEE